VRPCDQVLRAGGDHALADEGRRRPSSGSITRGSGDSRAGEGGWELVSVQHANSAGDMGGGGEIDQTNAVAYFKRPSSRAARSRSQTRLP